jgi:hypothetical protein
MNDSVVPVSDMNDSVVPVSDNTVSDNTVSMNNSSEQNISSAFSTVIDYIADTFANKFANKFSNFSGQQPNTQTDGFTSNVNAAEETANLLNSSPVSTGGKKTRKFRITNKKKTRHQKK